MLSQSGGTCICNNEEDPTCATDLEYSLCVIGEQCRPNSFCSFALSTGLTDDTDLQRELITATAAISGFASILFGLLTNLPVALAYVINMLLAFRVLRS